MSQARIDRHFAAARQMIKDAAWADGPDVCMCRSCVTKREGTMAGQIIKRCYPRLPFVPEWTLKELGIVPLEESLVQIKNIRKHNENYQRMYTGTPTHFCRNCGLIHTHDSTNKHKGKFYCNNCFQGMFVCSDCGELESASHQYTKRCENDQLVTELVCRKCRRKLIFCSRCRMGESKELIKIIAHSRDEVGEFSLVRLCRECYEDGLQVCYGCGKTTHRHVAEYKNSQPFCPVCVEEKSGILSFDYKPLRPRFKKGKGEGKVTDKAFYMGWELEIAPGVSFIKPEAMCHMVKEHIGQGKIYVMEDGSISAAAGRDGMELACHPFTWEYYKKEGYKDWDRMCLYLKKHGWTGSYEGLGIHIHTTKAAWGTHQIYKLLKFIYNNQSFVKFVAERGQTVYCRYDRLTRSDQKEIAKNKINNNGESHYSAINLNNGESGQASKTIEFRIFQSRLEPFNFHKNIEFAHACYEFTKAESEMTTKSFKWWLLENRRSYPCLTNYLNLKEGVLFV